MNSSSQITTQQQGGKANKTGNQLEEIASNLIIDAGYEFIDKHLFAPLKAMGQGIYTRQFNLGNDLYGKQRKCDFILYHPTKHTEGLVIECKWQQSGGSVEEKFPFVVLNIQRSGYETIVILDGGGYSDGSNQWLRSQSGNSSLKHVFNIKEFTKYVNDGRL